MTICLQVDALGNSSIKSRSRRAVIGNTSKLSFKDLALELAKIHLLKTIADEQHDLQKAKESLNILTRGLNNETRFQFPADKCSNIKTIGKPVVHNSRLQSQGAWMKDPLEIMGAETIFVMEYYSGNVLEEYENMNKFKAGLIRKKFKLPYSWDGTGAVVYGQHLYYNRWTSTYYIVKYNLLTEGVETQITARSYNTRKQYYQWGGYSGMDLAVDEQGLWVIAGQSSSSYPLYLGKIDVVKNSIPLSWNLRTSNYNYFPMILTITVHKRNK
ncbi:olfactomedin-like protein 2A [Acropora palmata]|uniref:olfactomedin-like protein 2A n=1 Tax=Acropora palmata TaxID=6131 RepID=UPI003DA137C2